jgi:hypothetical protein
MTLNTLCRSIWGDSEVAGHPAIAALGASCAIDFSHSMKNAELLPPVAAGCTAVKIDEASRRRESGTKTVTCPRKRGSSRHPPVARSRPGMTATGWAFRLPVCPPLARSATVS